MAATQGVEDAIRAAVEEDNPGAIVTGYVIVIEATTPEDADYTAFVHAAAAGQSVAHTLGLLEIGRQRHMGRVGDLDE